MNKKPFPVCLSFDVDGDTVWRARDPENVNRPCQLSLGTYGLVEGLPRVLKLFKKYDIQGTFFVPGVICERYPDEIKRIDASGHEIANHSHEHIHLYKLNGEGEERADIFRGSDAVEKLIGKRPTGFRSPSWEFSGRTVGILRELGIRWSSNMMLSDRLHKLEVFDEKTDIVEIPVSWVLDDAAYWLYSALTPGKSIQPLASVEAYWKDEFEGLYAEYMEDETGERKNQCYMLACHPQMTGRPSRLRVLENLIRFIRSFPNVAFMTGNQMQERYRADNP